MMRRFSSKCNRSLNNRQRKDGVLDMFACIARNAMPSTKSARAPLRTLPRFGF
jgi:hypothetical protein